MGFIEEFIDRGYLYQCTNIEAVNKHSANGRLVAYIGFDCTASSLHAGHLMQIMIMRLLQKHGHKPIAIIGGATSKIGDPTGKEEARKALSDEELSINIAGIKRSLSKFLKFGDGESDALILNNSSWLESINYIDYLRQYGKLISVNRMIAMDSVRSRLEREQSLTFLEFNYSLLQAYDFYHLNKEQGCSLQLGGSDQWGNIVMGIDFTKKISGNEVFGMTTPLLTTSSGAKMGKSVGGAIWINEDLLSPYGYYQYWRNCEDLDVVRFTKLFTDYSDDEFKVIQDLCTVNINAAKKKLAYDLTKMCHGAEAADLAIETARKLFEEGIIDNNLPTFKFDAERFESGILAYKLLFEINAAPSKSEARKLIRGNGVKINDIRIEDENMNINAAMLNSEGILKVTSGKKNHTLVMKK